MATHSALFCQEVLETILENISPAETDGTCYHKSRYEAEKKGLPVSSRRTLLSAALVCKAFSKPALAALWRYIKDILPLMKLVGGLQGNSYRSHFFKKEGGPTEYEWSRIEYYALYVRGIGTLDLSLLLSSAWDVLAARYRGDRHLLPRVTHLWHVDFPTPPRILSLFLPPTLRYVALGVDIFDWEAHNARLCEECLETIAAKLPGLHSIFIEAPEFLTQKHLSSILRMKVLRDIAIKEPDVNSSFLAKLAELEDLRTLTLSINLEDDRGCNKLRGQFQQISDVDLSGSHADLAAFFQATAPPRLRSLELQIEPVPEIHDMLSESLTTIFSNVSNNLTHLRLNLPPVTGEPINSQWLLECVEPAFALRALKSFAITVSLVPSLRPVDVDVVCMAETWTALETLHLDFRYSLRSRPPYLSITTLAALARTRPGLRTLILPPLSLRDLPALGSLPPPLGHSLQWLKFSIGAYGTQQEGAEDEEILLRTAAYIDGLFPHISLRSASILAKGEDAAYNDDDFKRYCDNQIAEVFALLFAMRLGRQHGTVFAETI